MVIRELYVKNFGKLSEKHFYFRDGVQVISGENEFGKTTLHAFVKAMLFGLERGRGRAAAKDDFTKYEPASVPAEDLPHGLRCRSPDVWDFHGKKSHVGSEQY